MDKNWENVQQRVFTRWVNAQLVKQGGKIEDITKDFQDGLQLIALYEAISGKTFSNYNKAPAGKIHKLVNLNIIISEVNKFVNTVGIQISFSSQQVYDGDKRTILGMIWCLMHKYTIQEINEEEKSAKDGLLLWCQKQISGYRDIRVTNFNTSWIDGLAHAPNLVNYDSLKKENKAANLQLAFDIAEKHLDIPALLDVNDIVSSSRPDDKSIMTYVAYYWKKFASSKKGERSARKIGKVTDRQQEFASQSHQYEERATDLLCWINDKMKMFSETSFGNSLAKVQETNANLKIFKNQEKPAKNTERHDLEVFLKTLNSKQKNEGMFTYNAPEELAPHTLTTTWEQLEEQLRVYEKLMNEALQTMKGLDILLDRFNKRATQLLAWKDAKAAYLNEDVETLYEKISGVQARIKGQEAFDEELKGIEQSNIITRNIGNEIQKQNHEASQQITEMNELCESAISEAFKQSSEIMEKLNKLLEKKQQIEADCIAFGNLVQQVNIALDDIAHSISEPVTVNSIEEVDEKIAAQNKFIEEFDAKSALLTSINELHEKITSCDVDSGIYSSLSFEQITEKSLSTHTQLAQRSDELTNARSLQVAYAELLSEWSTLCSKYSEWVEESKNELNSIEEGSVWDQIQALAEKSTEVIAASQTCVEQLESIHQQLVEQDLVRKADVTLQEMTVLHSQIQNLSKKKNIELVQKRRQFEQFYDRFKSRCSEVQAWQMGKSNYLNTVSSKVQSISQIQAEIKTIQVMESEIQSVSSSWAEIRDMGMKLISVAYPQADEVQQSITETESISNLLVTTQQETLATLNTLLTEKQNTEYNCVEFAKIVQTLNLYIEETMLQLAESVKARSVQDAEEMIAAHKKLSELHSEKSNLLDQIISIDNEITHSGANSSVYSAIDLPSITKKYEAVTQQLAKRAPELDAEKKIQEQKAQILKQYNETALSYQSWVDVQQAEIIKELEGDFGQQLDILQPLVSAIESENEGKIASLSALYEQLEEADIAENASTSLTELHVLSEQIVKNGSKRIQNLEEAIVASKVSDVSEGQLKEWSQVFRQIDTQKSGVLNKLQFKAACAAIGEDLTDEQLDSYLAQYDKDNNGLITFDEFVDFMKNVSKEGSGYKDVMDAFGELAGNEGTITETQLRTNMPPAQADYLVSVMPKTEKGFDYIAYCEATFAKKE